MDNFDDCDLDDLYLMRDGYDKQIDEYFNDGQFRHNDQGYRTLLLYRYNVQEEINKRLGYEE